MIYCLTRVDIWSALSMRSLTTVASLIHVNESGVMGSQHELMSMHGTESTPPRAPG